ncbi:MAG: hypothetical protein O7A03_08610, partial [Alphaproteobacteria bacterium]|nr:hypothetical protein [Alphaproteobacteria bacterium]
IRVHGTADVNLECEVYSNTPFDQYGSSCFVSTGIYAVGEATGVCITPEKPVIMSEPVVDPLGYIDEPSYTGCTYPGGVTVGNGEDVYLDPGTYCGDFDVHGTAHLNPGLYFIHGGSLKFNAQSEVYGDGVTFFMDIGKKGQDFTINGGSYVDLSAPVDASVTGYDQLIGILFFQARDTLSDKEVHEFNGGAEMYLDGAIYTAGAQVEFNGGSIIGPSKTLIIADSVDIGGTSQFGSMYNSTVAFNPAFVGSRLVE